jgi:hypothetical protein
MFRSIEVNILALKFLAIVMVCSSSNDKQALTISGVFLQMESPLLVPISILYISLFWLEYIYYHMVVLTL